MSVCGNPSLLRLICIAVKAVFHENRPFIIVVIEEGGTAGVHSNMDVSEERVKLMEQVTHHCKQMTTGLILPFKVN